MILAVSLVFVIGPALGSVFSRLVTPDAWLVNQRQGIYVCRAGAATAGAFLPWLVGGYVFGKAVEKICQATLCVFAIGLCQHGIGLWAQLRWGQVAAPIVAFAVLGHLASFVLLFLLGVWLGRRDRLPLVKFK